jgi:hypothetical protein
MGQTNQLIYSTHSQIFPKIAKKVFYAVQTSQIHFGEV